MPIYEYRCPRCANQFELLRPMSQADGDALCPQCQGQAVRRLSVFASVVKEDSWMDKIAEDRGQGYVGSEDGCGASPS